MSEATAFSEDQHRTLAAVLDEIIPPSADGRLPGAGEVGLGVHVERGLAQMAVLIPMIAQGLAALDALAATRGAADFVALDRAARGVVLNELLATQPGFLGPLVFHAYTGYYQQPQVLAGIGLDPHPPHPRGHVLEPGDFGLLDAVRERGPIWRPS